MRLLGQFQKRCSGRFFLRVMARWHEFELFSRIGEYGRSLMFYPFGRRTIHFLID